ncbi:hypothetical protein HK097_005622 [Rhizophlyctis rosea]|uniref:Uncharacterized protein n=1 Tax=Rhizophlyctis rosea TaxID=64517 RepID=A0AAD5WYV1_9FUNG|nr:hypothetical protein HK097_005622 [Rhizophlyctis rosea]
MKVILNSALAFNKDATNPKFRFRNGLRMRKIRLSTAVIPVSWYNVTGQTNTLQIVEGTTPKRVLLPPGIYSGESLSDALSDALNETGSQSYSVIHDSTTMKLQVTTTGGTPFQFTFAESSAYKILGLTKDTQKATDITLPHPIDLSGCKSIIVAIDEVLNDTIYAGIDNLGVMDVIPVTVDYGGVLVHQNMDGSYVDPKDQVISTMSIRLLNGETLEPLDLNAENFQLVFDVI